MEVIYQQIGEKITQTSARTVRLMYLTVDEVRGVSRLFGGCPCGSSGRKRFYKPVG
jgi:hypothetical protein